MQLQMNTKAAAALFFISNYNVIPEFSICYKFLHCRQMQYDYSNALLWGFIHHSKLTIKGELVPHLALAACV